MFYFLQVDFDALLVSINNLRKRMRLIGQEMGDSCREGAETFHDNFTHEDGSRQLKMWSQHHSELMAVKGNATIITPTTSNELVAIGKKILLRNTLSQEVTELTVGSYMVLSKSGALSYCSPLVKIVLGAKKGDTRSGVIAGRKVSYVIEEIS